jgi:hypothetical protein
MLLRIGKFIWNLAKNGTKTAGVTGCGVFGAAKGSSYYMYDLASLKLYSKERLEQMKATIEEQSRRYAAILNARQHSVDSLAVGGELLSDMVRSGHVPVDVQAAYEAAYPHLAQRMDFSEAVANYHGQSLAGFLNPVKGKLFEMKYADWLNDGNLPEGYHASLAHLSNQPGWDLSITGPDGHVAELLQLKATDSVAYVNQAIERYPDIQVITTDEVYSKLVMHGANSTISNADLADHVAVAADPTHIQMDCTPPLIALALIAFTTYCNADLSAYAKARQFGERGAKTYLTYLLGGTVAIVTQTWWLGILAGIGARWLAGRGRKQREVYRELNTLIDRNNKILLGC